RLNFKPTGFVSDSIAVCKMCDECLFAFNHDKCVVCYLNSVNAKPSSVKRVSILTKQVWRARGKVETSVRQEWKPNGRTLSLYDSYPLTRIAETEEMHLAQTPCVSTSGTVVVPSRFVDVPITCYQRQGRKAIPVVQIVLWYLDLGCSRHMTGDHSKLINYVDKFIGTVRFGNDEFATIVGYGDYKLGDTVISRVYYVEGLKHNLFSVG
nr:integrase, catalytic region, zinc finger, CCHC-type, peptidase aspartic, catalytic [Tanacetum cinerariifolium]